MQGKGAQGTPDGRRREKEGLDYAGGRVGEGGMLRDGVFAFEVRRVWG